MDKNYRPWGLGRRGAQLLILALMYIWIITRGVILRDEPPTPGLFHTSWPDWLRLAEWYGAAAVALVYAWRVRDWPGWVALLIPPVARAGSYVWGYVVYLAPGGGPGHSDLGGSVLYVFLILTVLNCSGWADYPPRTARVSQEATAGEER